MLPLQPVRAAAQVRTQLGHDHARAAAAGCQRRRQPGDAATDDQHIAMDVLVHVAIRVFLLRRGAQATGVADETLVPHPGLGRPHEGLVVEAGREQRREPAVDAQQVLRRARPGQGTLRLQAVVQLDLGHLGVGNRLVATLELHQRRRLLDAAGQHAARAVVFPRARQHRLACRQYGRGQGVAGETLVAAAVETEVQRALAVEPDTGLVDARTGHILPPRSPTSPATACAVAASGSLPPEGANFPWGGPAGNCPSRASPPCSCASAVTSTPAGRSPGL